MSKPKEATDAQTAHRFAKDQLKAIRGGPQISGECA